MDKNTDKVPAGVAGLFADIVAHPAEEWKASGVEKTKAKKKHLKFSVLLQYPDGQTYFTWVQAERALAAVEKAKKDCLENYEGDSGDLTPLLVLSGHHNCLLAKEDFA